MLFDHGAVDSRKRVLVHRAAGNVGAYAVQMAKGVARRRRRLVSGCHRIEAWRRVTEFAPYSGRMSRH